MATSKRRTETSTGTPGAASTSFIDVDFEHGTVVNVHGYRAMVAIEPQDADANANGFCAVYVLPGGIVQNSDLPTGVGDFGNEDIAPYLWGIVPWVASNQTPWHWEFAPKTTRNVQRGGRIVLEVFINGLSAGLARVNTCQTMFTKNVA